MLSISELFPFDDVEAEAEAEADAEIFLVLELLRFFFPPPKKPIVRYDFALLYFTMLR